MFRRLVIIWFVPTLLASLPAHAAFILDDFDDPAQLIGEGSMDTAGVGDLNAARHLGIGALQADLIGSLDADLTNESQLTAEVTGISGNIGLPIISFNTGYSFTQPTDFTDSGSNDAFFIDVTKFEGPGLPHFLRVTFRDAKGIFFAVIPGSQLLTEDPARIVVPFRVFAPRDGVTATADLSTIDLIEVLVRLTTGFSDPNQHWFVQIDRISVGRVVPEPTTHWLVILSALMATVCHQRFRWSSFWRSAIALRKPQVPLGRV